jgi:hypothetical protein
MHGRASSRTVGRNFTIVGIRATPCRCNYGVHHPPGMVPAVREALNEEIEMQLAGKSKSTSFVVMFVGLSLAACEGGMPARPSNSVAAAQAAIGDGATISQDAIAKLSPGESLNVDLSSGGTIHVDGSRGLIDYHRVLVSLGDGEIQPLSSWLAQIQSSNPGSTVGSHGTFDFVVGSEMADKGAITPHDLRCFYSVCDENGCVTVEVMCPKTH